MDEKAALKTLGTIELASELIAKAGEARKTKAGASELTQALQLLAKAAGLIKPETKVQ